MLWVVRNLELVLHNLGHGQRNQLLVVRRKVLEENILFGAENIWTQEHCK